MQPFSTNTLASSPDAERLQGALWPPSGLAIGASGIAYVGDGWGSCVVTATGVTNAVVSIARKGPRSIYDARNILLGQTAKTFKGRRAAFLKLLKQRREAEA